MFGTFRISPQLEFKYSHGSLNRFDFRRVGYKQWGMPYRTCIFMHRPDHRYTEYEQVIASGGYQPSWGSGGRCKPPNELQFHVYFILFLLIEGLSYIPLLSSLDYYILSISSNSVCTYIEYLLNYSFSIEYKNLKSKLKWEKSQSTNSYQATRKQIKNGQGKLKSGQTCPELYKQR